MTSQELRQEFLDFFAKKGHKIVPSSSLIPDDSSVLFTTAGMQQFKPYYLGTKSPWGPNVASIQKCFRTSDIDEVGDSTHNTFLEMLGNFSFGGYFKKEAVEYAYEFIAKKLDLEIEYVTIFEGDSQVPRDIESREIWKKIVPNIQVREQGREDNFWGPTGLTGPCGPTTEIYVANSKGEPVEIWNIVFNEFYCNADKSLAKLETPGVDTGMGLERLAMVAQKKPTIFETDLFQPLITRLPASLPERDKRIFADHGRAVSFLVADGVKPSNKEQGYVLRRLLRRIIAYGTYSKRASFSSRPSLLLHKSSVVEEDIFVEVIKNYNLFYPELNLSTIMEVFAQEKEKFGRTMKSGLKELNKMEFVDAKTAFKLYESFGLPYETIKDVGGKKAEGLSREGFDEEFKKHQELSRSSSSGMFKGGLVDHEPQTIKHHTAHHLLLAALRQVLGSYVVQRGSNVSSERLRLDFSHPEKLTKARLAEIEEIVNQKISESLEVRREEMPKAKAEKLGALAEFGAKYGEIVNVYTIYNKDGTAFSREFCGGPHVKNTSELGRFKIIKEEAAGSGVRRIKASIEQSKGHRIPNYNQLEKRKK
ncbi:MAG: alanyl-tRNA synthetase [Parcubacteria group bacterium Gr01-1014_30]|nr:MAG: alanyl-tRNA synthetase [Parcubacteria group bacterium Gr01-1014_30]